MTTALARQIAPHVIGALDIVLIDNGGDPRRLASAQTIGGAVLGDLAYQYGRAGVTVTRSPAGAGHVDWRDITAIVRAGITPGRVEAVRQAQAGYRDRRVERDRFLAACPWNSKAGRTDEAQTENRRLIAELGRADRAVRDAVAVIVNAGIEHLEATGQLELDLDEWLGTNGAPT